ncbi:MAG: hypothetical protein SF053_21605 [Bacteroidia bacterium]|nr:hypothetical protein [Bacteroidia bacterium]
MDYQLPQNPILSTAWMVKALVWYCGDDRKGSTHSTNKVLEWVGKTPLDTSPENTEAREMLTLQIIELLFKVVYPPFNDYDSAIRLVECALTVHVDRDKTAFMEQTREQLYIVRDNPVRQTVLKVKFLLEAGHNNPARDTDQALEWVRQTPLDDSPEQLEAREMLAERMRGLAVKLAQAPFYAPEAALRLLECALNLHLGQDIRALLEEIRRDISQKTA